MLKTIGLIALLLTQPSGKPAGEPSLKAPKPPPTKVSKEVSTKSSAQPQGEAPFQSLTLTDYQDHIRQLLKAPGLAGSTTGLIIKRPGEVENLFAHNPDLPLVPASTIKLFTTALALDTLGPDYRFITEVRGKLSADGLRIEGDLFIKGYGDPWLVPERLWMLGQNLKATGVREITGDIVADPSFFAGPQNASGIEQDTSSKAYMAPAGALSVGFNAVKIHVRPNRKVGEPATVYLQPSTPKLLIEGSIKTVTKGRSSYSIEIHPRGDANVVTLSGVIRADQKPHQLWRRITNPAVHAAAIFRDLLNETGVKVIGTSRKGVTPDELPLLTHIESPRLADLVSKVNKFSNNFMASQLYRTVGAHVYGAPGSSTKGQKALQRFLKSHLDLSPESYTVNNASGLHDVNRVSPAQVIKLLEHFNNAPRLRIEYLNSLAVSGGTGTLDDRMTEERSHGLIRAKTGTLAIASALSGYAFNPQGELLLFSIITNHYKHGIQAVLNMQNQLGEFLTSRSIRTLPPPIAANGESSKED
ncbi:MAG: D-alanyl-D-alanine carboxypeptidase/D-alanyl-D-alanine-endopeptidase [Myxococcota bacterium]|nr:D-alanyl-D-alanine carboxypeptidase/D-alanyl-D-alanine-endopeptidase [Myxococcota bacterium]